MKYNFKGLSILVRNEEESEFVLKLAWDNDYMWRDRDYLSNENRLSSHPYREDCNDRGEFIYCFDHNDYEDGVLSCFSGENMEEVIKLYNVEVIEASQLMEMDDAAREIFLRLR
jgi:hypothetical protein